VIYFDNNATTQPLPEVIAAMDEALGAEYANPSSVHQFGQRVRHRVEVAREQVANLIGASPKELIFTSGGTESINLAIRGGLQLHPNRRRFVTTAVEHSAGLRVAEQVAAGGYEVVYVGVDRQGRLDAAEFAEKVTQDTALVSFIHANNETGVLFDVAILAAVAHDRGVPVHVDAVQSAGKLPIDVHAWPVDLVSIAAHKLHGPKGVGALYVKRRTRLVPQIVGGGQERLLRGGTENVPGIIGMGVAAEIARRDLAPVSASIGRLRDALESGVLSAVPIAHVNGCGAPRIHNTSNISFEGLEAEAILLLLSEAGVCASSGSACSSGSLEPSHVLKAMGLDERLAHGAVRFSLSRLNTADEVGQVVAMLPGLLSRLTVLSGA
jgi:cysteine desulfurase